MVLIITSHEYRRKLEQTFQNFRIPIILLIMSAICDDMIIFEVQSLSY